MQSVAASAGFHVASTPEEEEKGTHVVRYFTHLQPGTYAQEATEVKPGAHRLVVRVFVLEEPDAPSTPLGQLARLYPNVRALQLVFDSDTWEPVYFPQLVELVLKDAFLSVHRSLSLLSLYGPGEALQRLELGNDLGLRQTGSLHDLLDNPIVRKVPALALCVTEGFTPLRALFTPARRELKVTVELNWLYGWNKELQLAPALIGQCPLHTLHLTVRMTVPYGEHMRDWGVVAPLVGSLVASLNTLEVGDHNGAFDPMPCSQVAALLLTGGTNITHFSMEGDLPLLNPLGKFSQRLPNLCHINACDGPFRVKYRQTVMPVSLNRDLWGYLCVALACLRANHSSAIKRSYAPLMATIAALIGWNNECGAINAYARKQQDFAQRLFSLTGAAKPSPAARKRKFL